jgi:hypothetical protein
MNQIIPEMKNLILSLIAFLITASLSAQTVDTQSQNLIETFVKSNIDTKSEPIDPAVVSKVFSGKFFKIKVGFIETGVGAAPCGSDNYVNINGTTIKMIEGIYMDLEFQVLMSLIKKDFLLKDENAAKLFEASLNVLYTVDEKEVQNIKHFKKGSQWIFLRGKFFDDYTAIIVTTGTNGIVTKIEVKLAYPMN